MRKITIALATLVVASFASEAAKKAEAPKVDTAKKAVVVDTAKKVAVDTAKKAVVVDTAKKVEVKKDTAKKVEAKKK